MSKCGRLGAGRLSMGECKRLIGRHEKLGTGGHGWVSPGRCGWVSPGRHKRPECGS